MFISKDLGQTWQAKGLVSRGVMDLKYFDQNIYAATYYWTNNEVGLFVSQDKGSSWTHLGNNFTVLSVDRDENTIYIGGASHGLWISTDEGQTWIQKIGDGWTGPQVSEIESSPDYTFAISTTKVYKSHDHGINWEEVTQLTNKGVGFIEIRGDMVVASSSAATGGAYISENGGSSWKFLSNPGDSKTGDTILTKNGWYMGNLLTDNHTYTVLKSFDQGVTWENTGLNLEIPSTAVTEFSWLYSNPEYLFAVVAGEGLYRFAIPPREVPSTQFLSPPWQTNHPTEFVDKIYSYFDHTYPFLGYGYFREPTTEATTTLNFFGIKGIQPDMYYSSHDGYDYSLTYGTPIIAPASGIASYSFCPPCGNTIKINHPNGYQTTYMHLQKDGLITTTNPIAVDEGDVIGKVGMTGNTTGPHLHFAVLKDLNANGIYEDDVPDGRVDPYAWQNNVYSDPWESFSWSDSGGEHLGSASSYLWKQSLTQTSQYINGNSQEIVQDNKTIILEEGTSPSGYTVEITPYGTPYVPENQKHLGYIPNTSFIINAFDHFQNKLETFSKKILIKIIMKEADLQGYIFDQLKLYVWNEYTMSWDPVPLLMLNLYDYSLIAETEHLSHFAVFGIKANPIDPSTTIQINGTMQDEWYTEHPAITLSSNALIFYALEEEDWQEYTHPFVVEKEGIFPIYYRSMNEDGYIERVQTQLLKVDTQGLWKKKLQIKGAVFNAQ